MKAAARTLSAVLALWSGLAHANPVYKKPVSSDTPSPSATINARALATCTYQWSQATPYNIPTAVPYVSKAGYAYFPMGDQNGGTLTPGAPNVMSNLLGNDERTNPISFTEAAAVCSNQCDTDLNCKSFNVLVIYNNATADSCENGWTCLYSSAVYNANDYKQSNNGALASYAWSLQQQPSIPACYKPTLTPQYWVNSGMDAIVRSTARLAGILSVSGGAIVPLMEAFGWDGYNCDTNSNAGCDWPSITTCADWLNYQIAGYETWVGHNVDILDKIVSELQSLGGSIVDMLWSQSAPTYSTSNDPDPFSPTSLIIDIVNGALGVIPGVSAVASGLRPVVDAAIPYIVTSSSTNQPPPMAVVANSEQSWHDFMAAIQTEVNKAEAAMKDYSTTVTSTFPSLMSQVLQGGPWSTENNTGAANDPDVLTVWESLSPYYFTKLATKTLEAQNVFFHCVDPSVLYGGVPCTQTIADNIASLFGSAPSGTAFCDGINRACVPVIGTSMQIYDKANRLYPNQQSFGSVTGEDIRSSSADCYKPFPGQTLDIALWKSSQSLPSTAGEMAFDLTQPCVWNVPQCDYRTFSGYAKNAGYPTDSYRATCTPTTQQDIVNTAWYCAYNFGMVSASYFQGTAEDLHYGVVTGGYQANPCKVQWTPPKVMTIQQPSW